MTDYCEGVVGAKHSAEPEPSDDGSDHGSGVEPSKASHGSSGSSHGGGSSGSHGGDGHSGSSGGGHDSGSTDDSKGKSGH